MGGTSFAREPAGMAIRKGEQTFLALSVKRPFEGRQLRSGKPKAIRFALNPALPNTTIAIRPMVRGVQNLKSSWSKG